MSISERPIDSLLSSARTAASEGHYAEAVAQYTGFIAQHMYYDSAAIHIAALQELAELYTTVGDYPRALEHSLQCLNMYRDTHDDMGRGSVYHSIGVLFGLNGDYQAALDYLEKAAEKLGKAGNSLLELKAIRNIGAVHLSLGNLEEALECELRALTTYDAIGDKTNAAAAMITIGDIYVKQLKPDTALAMYVRAAQALEESDENMLLATALLSVGKLYSEANQRTAAQFALEQGLAIAEETHERRLQYRFHKALAAVTEAEGDVALALSHFRLYASIREEFINEERQRTVAELHMRFDMERALKEEELRRQHDVTKAVTETQESERRRVAGELHDGIGQLLAAVRLNLLRLGKETTGMDEDQAKAYNRSVQLIEKAASDVRTVSHALGSSTLRELGLVAALREVVDDMTSDDGVVFEFETSGLDELLPEYVALSLFRVAQELIANVVKYSRATESTMQLFHRDGVITLMVEDNGVGFDTSAKREGMGTRNIETRVRAMHGTVRFDSTLGHGTTVMVEVPIEES